jgi:hypothetical protein
MTDSSTPASASSASHISLVVVSSRVRADFTWSRTRLRAIVMNHATMSRPCQEKESIRRSPRRKVSLVRSSASWRSPTREWTKR